MRKLRLIWPVILLSLAACGGRNTLTDPAFEPEIDNVTDNFALQATDLTGVTQTVQYTWQNTGTTATIDHSSAITGGSATLTILDSMGQQLYSQPLAPSGNPGIGSGTAGNWTIRLVLTNVSGTLNFRVQKGP